MNNNENASYSRRDVLPAFIGTLVSAIALYIVMTAVQPAIASNALIPSFNDILFGAMDGNITDRVLWFFVDFSQATFVASVPASICLVIGSLVAAHLENIHSPHAGTGTDGNGRIFVPMLIASVVSVALGIIVFGNVWPGFTGWIPTFAALLVVQPLIIQFGATPAKLATITLLGTFTCFPLNYLIMTYIVNPMGVPLFISVNITIIILVPILAAILRALPWMASVQSDGNPEPQDEPSLPEPSPTAFFIHRVFGDVGELCIYGSSIGVAAMYAGTILAWLLNPLEPGYSAGNVPLLIASQIICAALSIFLYYPTWKREGFTFTFMGVVLTSAIVGKYAVSGTPADLVVAGLTIIIGATVFVPIIKAVMKAFHYKGNYPAIALIQLAILPVILVWSFVLMWVILPALGVA